ncbi:glycine--tRNA ligase subunit beta, partial [Xanthomonas campestris]
RHYAKAAGEPSEISLAIDEAYQPRFAGDDIALSPLGKVLAIAERLDTLAGGFAVGLKPTGNKDPFALRRNALGLARTVIESGYELRLDVLLLRASLAVNSEVVLRASLPPKSVIDTLVDWARDARNNPQFEKNLKDELFGESAKKEQFALVLTASREQSSLTYDFILDRLRGYYADKGVPATHFNAVAELKPASLYDFDRRIDAIGIFATLPEAEALAAANKRIRNILRKVEGEIPGDIDTTLLREPAEEALAEAVEAAIGDTGDALHRHDYVAVLARLARLRPQVDAFFDGVMVNADDPQLRANRLALLKKLGDRLGSVAAIEHLSS